MQLQKIPEKTNPHLLRFEIQRFEKLILKFIYKNGFDESRIHFC
jgi:hypothetical protein